MSTKIETLLLGTGYSLTHLLPELDAKSVLLTTTSQNKCESFQKSGFNCEILNTLDLNALKHIFQKYPNIRQIIDSVPPIRAVNFKPTKGIENILLASASLSLEKIIYLSTTGVFGHESGEWVDEKTICKPNNPQSQARLDSENLYFSSKHKVCCLRLSAIYGPERGIYFSLKNGRYKLIEGYEERWTNRIHLVDIVQSLIYALKNSQLPPIICLSDSSPSLVKDVVSYYCQRFSFDYPTSITKQEALNSGQYTLLSNQRVSNQLLKNLLNKELTYRSYLEGAGTESNA